VATMQGVGVGRKVMISWPIDRRRAIGPWSGRHKMVAAVVGVVVIVLLGVDGFLLTQRDVATRVSFDSTLQQYRAHQQSHDLGAGVQPLAEAATGTGSTATQLSGTSALGASADGPAQAARPAAAPGHSGPVAVAGAAPSAAPFALPAEGVYKYRTTGGESISVAFGSHSYPSETYATVRHQGGCQWQEENDVIQEHTDKRTSCSKPGQLLQLDESRYVTFYGKTDGATYTCRPPQVMINVGEAPGTTHDSFCDDGQGNGSRLHGTDLGMSQMSVGGVTVRVYHLVVDGTLTGRAQGTSHDELFLAADTGMVVVWNRSVDTLADAAFGANVRYKENATFTLESLIPTT
jgi:hypothetical protein